MTTRKQQLRDAFREAVFARDGYRCAVCGFQSSKETADHDLDAHHITPREQMPGGGYVVQNGVSLCAPERTGGKMALGCHYKAESVLAKIAEGYGPEDEHSLWYDMSPQSLYRKIGSSFAAAYEASTYLP